MRKANPTYSKCSARLIGNYIALLICQVTDTSTSSRNENIFIITFEDQNVKMSRSHAVMFFPQSKSKRVESKAVIGAIDKKESLTKERIDSEYVREAVIAVDVDEVLADFIPTLALYHNEMWGSNLSSASFHSYEFHHVWGGTFEECNVKMHQFFETTHLDQLSPVKGALEALQWLKDETGAELHIVTSRQHAIADRTRYWIDTHFPGIFKEVHFGNHYSSSGQKRSKPEMCQDIGALVIIDDSQKYAGHCAEAGIPCVLFGGLRLESG
jgi:uncharacterized HAD superfamily protein